MVNGSNDGIDKPGRRWKTGRRRTGEP